MIEFMIAAPATVEDGPILCGSPGNCKTASPSGQQVSITRFATSNKRFPDATPDLAFADWRRLVIAITFSPLDRIASAISTGAAFRPEFEITMPISSCRKVSRCSIFAAVPSSRSHLVLAIAPSKNCSRASKIGLTGAKPPARKKASSAMRCECPLPKACITPPAAKEHATNRPASWMAASCPSRMLWRIDCNQPR